MATDENEDRISVELRDHVLQVGIDRPAKLNGFTPKMLDELQAAYQRLEDDDEVRVAVLYAHGTNFTAGLDLPKVAPRLAKGAGTFLAGTVDPLDLFPPHRTKPVVVAVRGYCYTIGIELMLAADVVVAGKEARFRQHEAARGIMAGGGATLRFVQRAGWGDGMRYLLTGDEFDAAGAYRMHFVQEVVETGGDVERANEIAATIAAQAPLAVAAMRANARMSIHKGPEAAIAAINDLQVELSDTEDAAEGLRSFREKRPGAFTGR